jgi:hypothetical protein
MMTTFQWIIADAAGTGEDEGVRVRGRGEGGEAADNGRLAVDVGEAGRAVAGEDVAGGRFAKGGQAPIVLIGASPRFGSVAAFLVRFRGKGEERGTDPFCRNGPLGAAHKRRQSPAAGIRCGCVGLGEGLWMLVSG